MVFTTAGGGANQLDTGYEIDNSLRFNDNDSAYLSITPGSAGNRRTFTYSAWIKLAVAGATSRALLSCGSDSGSNDYIMFQSGDKLRFSFATEGSGDIITTRLFRDPSAWYHIVWAVDTTQATDSNRVKLYVNGTQATDVSGTYPSQNYDTAFNNTEVQRIGARAYSATQYYDGYMSDVHLIDGQQLAPTEFGETNDNGVWIPKKYLGTYGTNGFKLEFKNSGSLGTDTSGNGNNFTATNLTAQDNTTDTPTNNFCTLNPLNITASVALSEGNTKHTNSGGNDQASAATMGFANGKWYWEVKCVDKGEVGINLDSDILQLANDSTVGPNDANFKSTALITNSAGGSNDFRFNGGTETVNSSSVANNDILMVAVDADNTKIYFGVNGTWMNSGDPAGGTGELKNFSSGYTAGNFITPVGFIGTADGDILEFNFGNAPFSISSGNSDANGYGNFEYAVPSGYYALCTKNLAEYG